MFLIRYSFHNGKTIGTRLVHASTYDEATKKLKAHLDECYGIIKESDIDFTNHTLE